MKEVILISRCKGSSDISNGLIRSLFSYRGVYNGSLIKQVVVLHSKDIRFIFGIEYVMKGELLEQKDEILIVQLLWHRKLVNIESYL